MIDLVIPGTAILVTTYFIVMVFGIAFIFMGLVKRDEEIAAVGIIMLVGADALSAISSHFYMTTPLNSNVCRSDIPHPSSYFSPCQYPTQNPYEINPIHPLRWLWEGMTILTQFVGGALKIEVK